jgi:hypothetical protein
MVSKNFATAYRCGLAAYSRGCGNIESAFQEDTDSLCSSPSKSEVCTNRLHRGNLMMGGEAEVALSSMGVGEKKNANQYIGYCFTFAIY